MVDKRFTQQDIQNQGADPTFDGFPMTLITGYDPINRVLRRVTVDTSGNLIQGGNFSQKFEYDGSGNLIYMGTAAPGTATSDAKWQIVRFTWSGTNLTAREFAEGTDDYSNIWDDRASLSYS